ncbi:MAG: iron ABC transporter permease [Pseudomonadota bacterium]
MNPSTLVHRKSPIQVHTGGQRDGDRTQLARTTLISLSVLLLLSVLVGLATGPSGFFVKELGQYLVGAEMSVRDRVILETIRMPRVGLGILVGSALAVAGAVMQGLFRNPLADPGIVGVSSGASLGASAVIVLGASYLADVEAVLGVFTLPVAAFLGALATTALLYRIATAGGHTSIATLLLGGIAIAAFTMALTGILVFMADDLQLRDLTFWQLGSLAGATWQKCLSASPAILAILLLCPFLARGLNALALGEASAHHMGVSVQRFKNWAIVAVAAATGAAVAVSGGIGFVGIVAPHILRLFMGPDNRYLLIGSGLLGASLLLLCDAVSRTIVAPAELPIGIITALVGAPFFLWILLKRRSILGG